MAVAIFCARHIRRLHPLTVKAIKEALATRPEVIVGACHQGDLEVQKLLLELDYENVVVYQTKARPLPSLEWKQVIRRDNMVDAALVQRADRGLLIWDTKSPLIVLNVLRLLSAGKMATLLCDGSGEIEVLSGVQDWARRSGAAEQTEITASQDIQPASVFQNLRQRSKQQQTKVFEEGANGQLQAGKTGAFTEALLALAKAQGTAEVATCSGLARSSLYRSLQSEGRLEFNTVVKVLAALGYGLQLTKLAAGYAEASPEQR